MDSLPTGDLSEGAHAFGITHLKSNALMPLEVGGTEVTFDGKLVNLAATFRYNDEEGYLTLSVVDLAPRFSPAHQYRLDGFVIDKFF